MKEANYKLTSNFIEKTTANVIGGYSGLKSLFDKFILEWKDFGHEINHTNFQNFIDGKPILIGTPDNYSKSGSPYEFETFYERMFKFEYTGNGRLNINNNLEFIVDDIALLFSKDNLNKKEKKTALKQILLILDTQIKKSDNCKEIENPKLYPKLIYIKSGYIKTYDTIYSLYSDYLKGFEKVDFKLQENEPSINEAMNFDESLFKKQETFLMFKKYITLGMLNPYLDYSFVIQYLLEKKMIHKFKHKEYIELMKVNNLISDKDYKTLSEKGTLETLKNSSNDLRLNNFNNVFG